MDDQLKSLIDKAGVTRLGAKLAQLALPSVRIQPLAAAANALPGASRLGGLPDLPAGVSWPRMEVAETPLAFLAQINLADVAPYDRQGLLPRTGMLYFFADPEEPYGFEPSDSDHWHVIYSETLPTGGPASAPEDLESENLFKESAVTFATEWTLPPYESPMVDDLHLSDSELEAYCEAGDDGCIHRLLGHPQQIQGYVPYEVAMAQNGQFNGPWDSPAATESRAKHDEWVLLFQLDSDWKTNGMMWGDVGRLYFYMRKQDLADRRFDRTWLMMQCS